MNFLNEETLADCSMRKKNGSNFGELRLAAASVPLFLSLSPPPSAPITHTLSHTHTHWLSLALIVGLPIPFVLENLLSASNLGLGNDAFVKFYITCCLHCEKTGPFLSSPSKKMKDSWILQGKGEEVGKLKRCKSGGERKLWRRGRVMRHSSRGGTDPWIQG